MMFRMPLHVASGETSPHKGIGAEVVLAVAPVAAKHFGDEQGSADQVGKVTYIVVCADSEGITIVRHDHIEHGLPEHHGTGCGPYPEGVMNRLLFNASIPSPRRQVRVGSRKDLVMFVDLVLIGTCKRDGTMPEMCTYMSIKEIFKKKIVGIHKHNENAFGVSKASLEGSHLPAILLMPDKRESGRRFGRPHEVPDEGHRIVLRTVVNDDALEMRV